MNKLKILLSIIAVASLSMLSSCFDDGVPAPTKDQLVSFYKFDGDGTDQMGVSDATVKNGIYAIDKTFSNKSVLYLDGTGYVDSNSGFDYPQRSLCIWFKALDITTTLANIFVCNYEGNLYGSTTIGVQEISGLPKVQLCLSEYSHYHQITEGVWYNAVLVQDGLNFSFYLDGILVDSGVLSGYFNSEIGYQNAVIGANRYFDRKMKGYLAEVRLYKKALTAEEVKVIYSYSSPDK